LGDEILKFSYLVFLFFFIASTVDARALSQEALQYNALFETINQKRFGLTEKAMEEVKDPFAKQTPFAQEDSTKNALEAKPNTPTLPPLKLFGLFKDRAKINTHWVRIGQSIQGYALHSIQKRSVTLSNAHHSLTLTLSHKGNANVVVVTEK
jgi:hypothetical protein